MVRFKAFGFYTIDAKYLEFLHQKDTEVYYNSSYYNTKKPFVGIVVGIGEFQYFIPMTSAKDKHAKWKNVTEDHFLIYEIVMNKINITNHVYKKYNDEQKMHILAVLDLKKMIPVPAGVFQYIKFDELDDLRYSDLFKKEYAFCLAIQEKILAKAEAIYIKQMESGIVRKMYCNFKKLENALFDWEHNVCSA